MARNVVKVSSPQEVDAAVARLKAGLAAWRDGDRDQRAARNTAARGSAKPGSNRVAILAGGAKVRSTQRPRDLRRIGNGYGNGYEQ